jgi:hypothetical protein
MHMRSATPLLFLALSAVVACGGKVVLDGGGGGGGAITAGGATLDCPGGGPTDADGDCWFFGMCTDGNMIDVVCMVGPDPTCICTSHGVAIGTCTPSDTPPTCELSASCCAAFF